MRATDRIGVGILGTGRISDLHAIEYVANGATEIVAVCDVDAERAMERAHSWGAAPTRAYTAWRELVADPAVDAVEVLLPHDLHLEVGLEVLAAGKHLSTQKPIAFTVAEADRFARAAADAEQRGQVVRIFENFLFYPPIVRLLEVVRSGEIGEILAVRQKSLSGDPACGWNVPLAAAAWRFDLEQCGGGPLVFDDGLHKFSIFWSLLGVASEVHAWIGSTETAGGTLDAPSVVTLRWPSNAIGSLEVIHAPRLQVATNHYVQDDRIEVTGTRGVAWVNRGHGRLLEEPPLRVYRDGRAVDHVDLETGWERSFVHATRDFIDAIRNGRTSLLSARDHRDILGMALAAQDSQRAGGPVRVSTVA